MTLAERMQDEAYAGYAYSYPHKTAYRSLEPAVPLADAWRDERKDSLFLYVHIPFCEMRCGFCNLFTTVGPPAGLVTATLAATERQSRQVAACVEPRRVVQAALGGGTPSLLSEAQLEALFAMLSRHWPVRWGAIPLSVEVSPATATPAKLRLLRELGVTRLSLGAQSFVEDDLRAMGRPAHPLGPACEAIRAIGFPVFNLDLIYGAQSPESWLLSLERALRWSPEELYLYPLYVGPLTGLERTGRRPRDDRRSLYRLGRERLLQAGYHQVSMRLFRRGLTGDSEFCCQEDGMVGLGPGARSYTRALHYSSEYAVGRGGVRRIIESFNERADFRHADYGAVLDLREQKLRHLLKSLLRREELTGYRARFGTDPLADHPRLAELRELGLASAGLRLTEEALEWSDAIGPWLYSDEVLARMESYQLT